MDVSRQRGLKQAEHMIAAAEHLSNTAVPVFCTFLSITDFTLYRYVEAPVFEIWGL